MPSTRNASLASSFLAGAATASVLWVVATLLVVRRNTSRPSTCSSTGGSSRSAPSNPHELSQADDDAGMASREMDEPKQDGNIERASSNRIGELPSIKAQPRPIPWPWMDTVRQSSANLIDKLSSFAVTNDEQIDKTNGAETKEEEEAGEEENNDDDDDDDDDDEYANYPGISPVDPKALCIGSIFGLDVGGTLAKLVYFEQRGADGERHQHNRREHYHQAAMARAVLEARRSGDSPSSADNYTTRGGTGSGGGRPHSRQSELDLERMWQLRQASVPDELSAFGEEAGFSASLPDSSGSATAPQTRPLQSHYNGNSGGGLQRRNVLSKSFSTLSGMKKSRSMLDMIAEKAEALDRFYNFARRLDTYEMGVKDKQLSFYSRYLAGEIHFIRFETRRMKNAMELIRVNNLHLNIASMGATGGGAHKYEGDWKRSLGIQMDKVDELDSLVAGMQFILADVVGECYTFQPRRQEGSGSFMSQSSNHRSEGEESKPSSFSSEESDYCIGNVKAETNRDGDQSSSSSRKDSDMDEWWWSRKVQRDVVIDSDTYPYLIVTIGTGVSILRVDGPRKHERISGSTIGGGTYWGLCRLLTNVESFEDVINLAGKGDPKKVDMMVGDIYGKGSDALEKLGLPANLVASSFGKLVAKQNPAEGLEQEDLARALLLMITNNLGQVAYLNAQIHKTKRIYFVGNFLRHNVISQQRLAFAINFWSAGKNEALFLEHEGYFGALGAFLLSQGIPHPTASSHKGDGKRRFHKRSQTQGTSKSDLIPVLETEHDHTSGRLRARTYSR